MGMESSARTDAELVEASRRGEHAAFGDLVERYQDVVCAVSYSCTGGDWSLSEDVAQETFIAAWRKLDQLRETERVRSWLCGIARNLARKARKRTDRDAPLDEDDDLPAGEASPFDVTAQAEVDAVVRAALARVPATYRETLVLYYCEGQSAREVASTLGIGEAAAMQRLTRGRRYLAEGVGDLIERALRRPRVKRNLAAAVLAALPFALPSRVDASPTAKGSTMLKLTLAALALAAAGTTAVVATRSSSSTPTSASPSPSASPGTSAATPAAAPLPTASPHAPTSHVTPAPSLAAADVVPAAQIAALHLADGPARGPATAPVTIIVFQDNLCMYCGKVLGTIDQLMEEYPNKLRLVVKQFPVHEQAKLAAEASYEAEAQGKFWELHDQMLAHQDDLSRDALLAYAQQAGMNVGKLADALDHHTYAAQLATDFDAAKQIGIAATPAFLINGKQLTGALPIEDFRAEIDAALAHP